MAETKNAPFSLEGYKIIKFSVSEPPEKTTAKISLKIDPSGKYYQKTGMFEQYIKFEAFLNDRKKTSIVNVIMKTTFKFETAIKFKDIPQYFFLNGIAIAFPYLRAFISSLTLQANFKPIVLPILNLTGMEKPLKQNTITILD